MLFSVATTPARRAESTIMLELFTAECRRFARWGTGLAAFHLIGLLALDHLLPGLRESGEITETPGLAAAIYALAGVVLGFYQAATYGRMNQWIALLHRPLAPWRIMVGVIGAGATTVFVAVLIPLLIFTATIDVAVGRVVDERHWLLAASGALIGVIGYLAGSYAALAPRRYGWAGVVGALILTMSNTAGGGAAPLFQLLVIAVLALLVAGSFKPDRTTAPANPGLLALTAGVSAVALYILMVVLSGLVYQMTLVALGRNALVNTPPRGGLVEASRADGDNLIADALAGAATREAADVRARLAGTKVLRLPIAVDWLPRRGELTDAASITFIDPRRGITWTYSHDANAFLGTGIKNRRPVGTLQPQGGFEAPPLQVGDGLMVASGSLYRVDPTGGTIDRVLRLPAREVIVAKPVPIGANAAILGDRALHLLDASVLGGQKVASGGSSVPLPGAIGNLRRLDVAPLPDRTIVSFFFGRDSIEGSSAAWQQVVSVTPDGFVRVLAQRSFSADFSNALRFRSYWLSPGLRIVAGAIESLGAIDAPVQRRAAVDVPHDVWIAAGVLSLLAAACAAVIARRRRLRSPETAAWVAATLLLGLPLLVTFILLGRRVQT
jgi:hypothetical protein